MNYEKILPWILIIILFASKFLCFINSWPLTELDSVANLHSYEIIMNKGGNPITNDYFLRKDQGFIINRTYGTFGVPAGFLMLLSDEMILHAPFFLMGLVVLLTAVVIYYYYGQKGLIGLLAFTIALLSTRSYYSVLWGQWAYLTALLFVFLSMYFFKKKDFAYTLLSLFVLIQVHQLSILIVVLGFTAYVITKKERGRFALKLLLLLALTQIPFIDKYLEVFSLHAGTIPFDPVNALLMTDTMHYPAWFYHNYLKVWGISLILIPLGFYYGFKKKDYFLITWFLLVLIFSRPSLIPLTKVQLRLSVALPLIGSMIAANGLRQLKNKKIVYLAIILVCINFGFNIPYNLGETYYHLDTFNWIRNNLQARVFTFGFKVEQKYVWWATYLSNNTFFQPRIINGRIVGHGYSDLSGNYTITNAVVYASQKVAPELVLYENEYFKVIGV